MSDTAISVKNLSKCYQIYENPRDRLKQLVAPRMQRILGRAPKQYFREFWALKDVSFEIKKGETVGIIGHNGSGKSTLLQLICGTLNPTSGSVHTNGRIAALLELGSGFNPEFTGRENVYMNAAILGLSKSEVDAKFNDIVAFAEIGQFIERPVKTYSSGMMVRLAFSVAINVDPQILIVDEALSVGDELFQRKCFARIEELRNRESTILFVSHSGGQVTQLCDRAILLDAGENLLMGEPKPVVNNYQRLLYAHESLKIKIREEILAIGSSKPVLLTAENGSLINNQTDNVGITALSVNAISYVPNGAFIDSVVIKTMEGQLVNVLHKGNRYHYMYKVHFDRDLRNVRFGMLIKTKEGMELGGAVAVYGTNSGSMGIKSGQVVDVDFSFDCRLNPGTYFTNAGVTGGEGGADAQLHRILDAYAFKVIAESDDLATAIIDFGCDSIITLKETTKHK